MNRKWMAALGAVAAGALAAGGYWYVDRELRAAADAGLQQINAFYAARRLPPVTYERLETHVFSLAVTLYDLRQKGAVNVSAGEQSVDSVIASTRISKGRGNRIDMEFENAKLGSRTAVPTDGRDARMESVITIAHERIDGFDLAALKTEGRLTDPFTWFDKIENRGIAAHFIVSGTVSDDEEQQIDFTAAEGGLEPVDGGLRRAFFKGIGLSTSSGLSVEIRSASVRLRPSDAFARMIEATTQQMTPETAQALLPILADGGRALAGFAIEGLDLSIPGVAEPVRLDTASVDELNWRDGILTDLAFHVDHLKLGLSTVDDGRALLEEAGIREIDQSMNFGLHYAPDAGTLRLSPLTSTTEGLLAVSLSAGVDNLHLPKIGLADVERPQAAQMQLVAAAINAVPTPVSLRAQDLGGLKKLVAALAAQNGVSADALAQEWSAMVRMQAGAMMEPEAAERLADDVRAFLTGKPVLNVRVAPRRALSFAAMTAMPPAQAVEVTSSAE
ncbi:exported hypothetical protein [uncultured Alphaproteobacteria bacterium]|uniref:DUF945 domain-containing protein n=1 Tax=uncultured Alphaproteobacteria bacterium TaxID=91750 RepID=A0A212JA06_9PROT|nr:exported hypothetical protein [uncultured Alphaproteobacteria bacterium]